MFGILSDAHKETIDHNLRQKFRHYEFDDEDDGYIGQRNSFSAPKRDLRIRLTEENIENLQFFRSVLSAYIESYWVAASSLSRLIGDQPKEEKSFFNGIIEIAKEKQKKGLLFQGMSSCERLSNFFYLTDSSFFQRNAFPPIRSRMQ